jgi:hypothetical protein
LRFFFTDSNDFSSFLDAAEHDLHSSTWTGARASEEPELGLACAAGVS